MRKALIGVPVLAVVLAVVLVFFSQPEQAPKLRIKTLDPWILQSNDPDALANKQMKNVNDPYPYGIYIGNGHIGARIGPEGVGRVGPCYMSGLYEDEGLKPLPIWSDFPLYDSKGKRFQLDKTAPYRQTLNMKEGYVETELTLKSGRQRLLGKVTFLISRDQIERRSNIAAIRYQLLAKTDGIIKVRINNRGTSPYIFSKTSSGVALMSVAISEANRELVTDQINVKKKQEFTLTKYLAITDDVPSVGNPARTAVETAMKQGFDNLMSESKKSWRTTWGSDIIIDGDPAAQQAIHAMMFYLLCSASPNHSIPPTGLSSGAWRGHIFWDADTWMMPALLMQYPHLASGLVRYRERTLQGASKNASKRQLKGIEFAWESAETGKETIGLPTSEERHVTADAIMAAIMCEKASGSGSGIATWFDPASNRFIDSEISIPLVKTADYWCSRAKYNKVQDRYEILDVVPPDENAEIVDNSVYTNAAAKRNIELAIAAAKKAGKPVPQKWVEVAKKMYIPFDDKNNRFLIYDGYKDQQIKQADPELLIYPLCYPMSQEVKKNTFDFYKTKTDQRGPAMTSSIHAIIAAELNRPQEAYDHFLESYTDFLRGPFLIFNEKRSKTYDCACFVTGCGGTIQSVLYGFGGLRIGHKPEGFAELLPDLYIKPCLPPKWKKLEIKNLQWRGQAYDLVVTQGNKWEMKKR